MCAVGEVGTDDCGVADALWWLLLVLLENVAGEVADFSEEKEVWGSR